MIIYKVTNKVNNKIYIGQTCKPLQKRWKEHCYTAYHGSTIRFHRAIRKYKPKNFKLSILYKPKTKQKLQIAERILIKIYKSFDFRYGYI